MRPCRTDRSSDEGLSRRGGPLAVKPFQAFCLAELLTAVLVAAVLAGVTGLALHRSLDSSQARLAAARRESESLLRWFQGKTRRALAERRSFRLHFSSSQAVDVLYLRWDDTGRTERFDGRGRLFMRRRVKSTQEATITESVFSPLFHTFSPAFTLDLFSPPEEKAFRPFRFLVVSVQGRIRLADTPP